MGATQKEGKMTRKKNFLALMSLVVAILFIAPPTVGFTQEGEIVTAVGSQPEGQIATLESPQGEKTLIDQDFEEGFGSFEAWGPILVNSQEQAHSGNGASLLGGASGYVDSLHSQFLVFGNWDRVQVSFWYRFETWIINDPPDRNVCWVNLIRQDHIVEEVLLELRPGDWPSFVGWQFFSKEFSSIEDMKLVFSCENPESDTGFLSLFVDDIEVIGIINDPSPSDVPVLLDPQQNDSVSTLHWFVWEPVIRSSTCGHTVFVYRDSQQVLELFVPGPADKILLEFYIQGERELFSWQVRDCRGVWSLDYTFWVYPNPTNFEHRVCLPIVQKLE